MTAPRVQCAEHATQELDDELDDVGDLGRTGEERSREETRPLLVAPRTWGSHLA